MLKNSFLAILLFNTVLLQAQDTFNLPDPKISDRTDEYELIVLDGDTVLRSLITKEVYTKNFRKMNETPNLSISMDWMNIFWDNSKFNSFAKSQKIVWPLLLSFEGERFVMPIKGRITSRYGWRKGRAHKGIDIDLDTGDNVMVALDGKVRMSKYISGFGNCVVVRHNNGLETVYAHLSKLLVKANDYVYSGQVIGKGGNTGRSRGSHLHFETRYLGQPINPEYLFDFEETNFYRAPKLLVDQLWADPKKHRSYKKSNIVVKKPASFVKPLEQPVLIASNTPQQTTGNDFEKQKPSQSSFSKGETNNFESTEEYHVIQRGDTLAKIANKYSTTISQITILNGISKSYVLKIGEQLRVK